MVEKIVAMMEIPLGLGDTVAVLLNGYE